MTKKISLLNKKNNIPTSELITRFYKILQTYIGNQGTIICIVYLMTKNISLLNNKIFVILQNLLEINLSYF